MKTLQFFLCQSLYKNHAYKKYNKLGYNGKK